VGNLPAYSGAPYDVLRLGMRVWRDYRGMGLNKLALKAGVARGYLSEIENGKKAGSMSALRRLAGALNIRLDDAAPGEPVLRAESTTAGRAALPKTRAGKGLPRMKGDKLPATRRSVP
jgi:transcriptional regulator with XRE-family HTH domain